MAARPTKAPSHWPLRAHGQYYWPVGSRDSYKWKVHRLSETQKEKMRGMRRRGSRGCLQVAGLPVQLPCPDSRSSSTRSLCPVPASLPPAPWCPGALVPVCSSSFQSHDRCWNQQWRVIGAEISSEGWYGYSAGTSKVLWTIEFYGRKMEETTELYSKMHCIIFKYFWYDPSSAQTES